MPGVKEKISRRLLRVLGATLGVGGIAGAGLLYYAARIEPRWLEVVRLDLTLPHLPAEFDGYRLVQVSDLHAGAWLPPQRLADVVDLVNRLDPDIIVITGDFVTHLYRGAPNELERELARLQAADGVVAVLGNHDYWSLQGAVIVRRIIKSSGLIDLNNNVLRVTRGDAGLYIAGVDSVRARRDRLNEVLEKLPPDAHAILLAHEPDFADKSAATGRFDLQLSGHAHGGQVAVPIIEWMPRLPPMGRKYPRGLYHVGNMLQYTNRGIGMVGLPFRFSSRPEVTVFTLRSGDRTSNE